MPSRNRSGSHSMERGMTDRSKQFRNWIILIAAALLLILIIHLLRGSSPPSDVSVSLLPCTDEDVITPFGQYILYYDGRTLHCITDFMRELSIADRLADESECAYLISFYRSLIHRGDENEAHIWIELSYSPGSIHTICSGHVNIEQQKVELLRIAVQKLIG